MNRPRHRTGDWLCSDLTSEFRDVWVSVRSASGFDSLSCLERSTPVALLSIITAMLATLILRYKHVC